MWLCKDKLKRKTAHFRLPSASPKMRVLKALPTVIIHGVPDLKFTLTLTRRLRLGTSRVNFKKRVLRKSCRKFPTSSFSKCLIKKTLRIQ